MKDVVMHMAVPDNKRQNATPETTLRESFDQFMSEHSPERLRNYGAIMDIPYAMLLPNGDDAGITSFRVLLNTRKGNGLVPATLHVGIDQMSNLHYEPYSDVSHFMDDGHIAECQGVFGHVSLSTASTYHVEGHGYGYPDWSAELTADRLSARVAEPDERWYQCLMYDVMDAREELDHKMMPDIRTPIADIDNWPTKTSDQMSL